MASPNQPEFFGTERRIIFPIGVREIDIEVNVYSQWKEWVKIGDNAKYPPAFRTVGGDPLTEGIDAGAYFFLQNQYGWRIRPAEEDGTTLITGNLAAEDPDRGIATPTLGTFSHLLLGLQPITQSVDAILDQVNIGLYGGAVYIDIANGTAGTSVESGIGQASNPSNNLADARVIADALGTKRFVIRGTIVLDQEYRDWYFQGIDLEHAAVDINGQDVAGTTFERISLYGTALAVSPLAGPMLCRDAQIPPTENLGNFRGTMVNCLVGGDISFQEGRIALVACSSEVAGEDTPQLEKNSTPGDLNVRAWTGGIEIRNFSNGDNCSIDLISGHIVIGPTNQDGVVVCRGVGELSVQEPSPGDPFVTIVRKGFVSGEDIKLIKALTAGDAEVSLDDLTVTIYDPDIITSPRTVLAVYDISADGRIRTRTS